MLAVGVCSVLLILRWQVADGIARESRGVSDSGPESSEFSSDDEESGLFSLSDHPPTSEELNFTLSEVDMKNHALQIQNAKTHYRVSTYNNLY